MIEIRKAREKKDTRLLTKLEKTVFPREYAGLNRKWPSFPETYILFVGKKPAGYVVVQPHRGLYSYKAKKYEKSARSLHISTTGILPRFRRKGLADVLKAWTI